MTGSCEAMLSTYGWNWSPVPGCEMGCYRGLADHMSDLLKPKDRLESVPGDGDGIEILGYRTLTPARVVQRLERKLLGCGRYCYSSLVLFFQNFYKADGNRTEMYVRYIDKLHTLHVDAQNYVEAGFTLLLYADLLPEGWVDDALQAELSYPPQRVWERKEALFKDIIDHFDKGKVSQPFFLTLPQPVDFCIVYLLTCPKYLIGFIYILENLVSPS